MVGSLRRVAKSQIQLKFDIIYIILKDGPGLCDSSLNAQNLKNLWTSSDVLYLVGGDPDPVVVGGEPDSDAKRPFPPPRQGDE